MPKVLPAKEAAAYLGLTPRTLRAMRQLGIGPKYIRMFVGRDTGNPSIGYLEEDLDGWIESCRVEPDEGLKDRAGGDVN